MAHETPPMAGADDRQDVFASGAAEAVFDVDPRAGPGTAGKRQRDGDSLLYDSAVTQSQREPAHFGIYEGELLVQIDARTGIHGRPAVISNPASLMIPPRAAALAGRLRRLVALETVQSRGIAVNKIDGENLRTSAQSGIVGRLTGVSTIDQLGEERTHAGDILYVDVPDYGARLPMTRISYATAPPGKASFVARKGRDQDLVRDIEDLLDADDLPIPSFALIAGTFRNNHSWAEAGQPLDDGGRDARVRIIKDLVQGIMLMIEGRRKRCVGMVLHGAGRGKRQQVLLGGRL